MRLSERDIVILNQVQITLSCIVDDLVAHRVVCPEDPMVCVGAEVTAALDICDPAAMRMLLEEAIIRLAHHHGSTITI
jgi:hypothetical protein